MVLALNWALLGSHASSQMMPNFGPNVFVRNPATPTTIIQSNLHSISGLQAKLGAQFDANRYAMLFERGSYNVTINMG